MKDPFFILGVPRSGTTLLAVLLNNHSQIYISTKSYLGRFLLLYQTMYDQFFFHGSISFTKAWKNFERLSNLSEPKVDPTIADIRLYLMSVLNKVANDNDKQIWGDKAPPFIDRIEEINFLFPKAKIIHLVRDPRSNVKSLVKRQYMDLEIATKYWVELNLKGLIRGRILGKDRYLLIKYEDLICDAEKTLIEICDFIGVKYEDKLVKDLEVAEETNIKGAYVKNYLDLTKVNNWEKELNTREIIKIEKGSFQLMTKLGYTASKVTEYKKLAPLRFLYLSLISETKLLFKSRRSIMIGRTLEESTVSLPHRVHSYMSKVAGLFFSDSFKELFKNSGNHK